MAKGTSSFLSRVRNRWKGSKQDFLALAEQCLSDEVYRSFEAVVERGYRRSDDDDVMDISKAYREWCHTFKIPDVLLYCGGPIHIMECPCSRDGLTQNQVEGLKRLGSLDWVEVDYGGTCLSLRLVQENYTGDTESAERVIQQALDILGFPSHLNLPPLPPVRTRYERLLGEDLLSV